MHGVAMSELVENRTSIVRQVLNHCVQLKEASMLNKTTTDGRTPLYRTTSYGDVEVVRAILAAGADSFLSNC
jgi:hypothetical protein